MLFLGASLSELLLLLIKYGNFSLDVTIIIISTLFDSVLTAGNAMEDVVITEGMVKKQAKKMKNWTASGKDEVHGFWIKHLTSLHQKIAQQLNQS